MYSRQSRLTNPSRQARKSASSSGVSKTRAQIIFLSPVNLISSRIKFKFHHECKIYSILYRFSCTCYRYLQNPHVYVSIVNCWPNPNNTNGFDVNIEYELNMTDLELQDLTITIPLPYVFRLPAYLYLRISCASVHIPPLHKREYISRLLCSMQHAAHERPGVGGRAGGELVRRRLPTGREALAAGLERAARGREHTAYRRARVLDRAGARLVGRRLLPAHHSVPLQQALLRHHRTRLAYLHQSEIYSQ